MGDFKIIRKQKFNIKKARSIEMSLLVSMIVLSLFGILNIYLCTKGGRFSSPYIFLKRQLTWFMVSMVVMYLILNIDYKIIYNYTDAIYWFTIFLLLLVWVPGIGQKVNGAYGGLNLRVCQIQPSELAKFSLILMLSKQIEIMKGKVNDLKNLSILAGYSALTILLILIQKDMGMTMVCFFIILGILFLAGLDKRIIYSGMAVLLIMIVIFWNSGLILNHQKERIKEFMSSDSNVTSQGYQLDQGMVGVGAGGLFGNKLSLAPYVEAGYAASHVPEIQTDFIFTAIGEQWGFLGAMFVLILYGIMIVKMINISKTAKDIFGSLISIGMVSYLLFAIFQNIGMTIKLLPITGITLPLLSYGGSSLLTTIAAITLVINVGMHKKKLSFDNEE